MRAQFRNSRFCIKQ